MLLWRHLYTETTLRSPVNSFINLSSFADNEGNSLSGPKDAVQGKIGKLWAETTPLGTI